MKLTGNYPAARGALTVSSYYRTESKGSSTFINHGNISCMKNRQKTLLYWGIATLVVASMVGAIIYYSNLPGELDELAKCLKDKGATFYGTYWCPACNQQKTAFGRSAQYLPYAECSDPGSKSQNALCSGLGIQRYPTWEFADGERLEGVLTPSELSEKTSCPLP